MKSKPITFCTWFHANVCCDSDYQRSLMIYGSEILTNNPQAESYCAAFKEWQSPYVIDMHGSLIQIKPAHWLVGASKWDI